MIIKVIFLDVDGVLNDSKCNARVCSSLIGIRDRLVKNLAAIVEATDAVIVLTSSWKSEWHRNTFARDQPDMGKYLQNKLAKQHLYILDKTKDDGDNRGEGIQRWLANHPSVTNWIVLDDDIFPDYYAQGIIPHLIHTSFRNGGLTTKHAERAIAILLENVDR